MALTNDEASQVLGMVARGDKDHDIAAWFGENQARIAEVKTGSHGGVSKAEPDKLPPKGSPGIKGRRLYAFVEKAMKLMAEGKPDEATANLQAGLDRFNQRE